MKVDPQMTDTATNDTASAKTGPNPKKRARRAQNKRQRNKASFAPKAVAAPPVPRPARPARTRPRHWGVVVSFVLMVLAPITVSGYYLYERAVDQYASTLAFTVRSKDISSAVDILGGLGQAFGGSGGNHDSDILFEYINSQELVAKIDAQLNLRGIFSRHADIDPLLSFDTDGTIEDLTDYWKRMVRVSYDTGSGLIELRVLAFDPVEAQMIAETIYGESSEMINALSAIARNDATRYAQEDLDLALERLKNAREALTTFRLTNQIVDPNADIQAQMGLLTTLQAQEAAALIEFDLISRTAPPGDQRVVAARMRLEVIKERIAEERQKFGIGGAGPGGQEYARAIAEFERLTVDREFAETAYAAAFSALDGARAEANRKSRYLAAYITPTLAEKSEFPQRGLMVCLVALFSFLTWSIFNLIYYAVRDRH
jgi:capsular polysaccharide transport system permease protein